jgi:radical SAM protein with 4Fe4S-binding SPASM domain
MDYGFFKEITTELKELGVKEIGVFFMGESFSNPSLLVDAVKHLKEIGIEYVFLTSNGSIASPIAVARCMEAGLDSLKWSINFADKHQFTKICGVKDTWYDAAIENIRSAWEIRERYGYKTKLYASSIKYDESQVEKMQPLLKESILPFVDQHYWLPLYSMGSMTDSEKIGLKPIAGNPGRLGGLVPSLPCWHLFTEGHIMSDGRVTACGADATGDWVVGNLNVDTFGEIWNSKEFQELRQRHLDCDVTGTKCEKCNG